MEEHDYILYWKDGRTEIVRGEDISKAFANAGYSHGALNALDFYETGSKPTYFWTGKMWTREIKNNRQ